MSVNIGPMTESDVLAAVELETRLKAIQWEPGWILLVAQLEPNPLATTSLDSSVPSVEARDRAFTGGMWRSDKLHWQHRAWTWLKGNETGCEYERYDATGRFMDTRHIAPPANMKIDGVDLWPNGNGLVFTFWMHEISSLSTRLNLVAHYVVEGTFHGYDETAPPFGAFVARELIEGTGGTPNPSDPIDYAMVRQVVDQAIAAGASTIAQAIAQLFGHGGSVRLGIMDKVLDAMLATYDPAFADDRAQAIRHLRANDTRDRAYEACMEALRQVGLGANSKGQLSADRATWPAAPADPQIEATLAANRNRMLHELIASVSEKIVGVAQPLPDGGTLPATDLQASEVDGEATQPRQGQRNTTNRKETA